LEVFRKLFMAVLVHIPTPLLRITQEQELIEVPAASISEIFAGLDRQFPGIGDMLMSNGKVRGFITVFLNDQDIRHLDAERTMAKDGDEVTIVPAIAGG
jgi:molybdopterin synthase sulfur carrier subunit